MATRRPQAATTREAAVVAACGLLVAKHGNRSASGACGSADVLEALGVRIDAPVETVQRSLDEVGWAFLFAPAFHASTRHAVGPRKELGVRTAFNLLGPLTNPAMPQAQLVGVPRHGLIQFVARCLGRLGVERAWVVHGPGLDEISLAGPTAVAALDDGAVRTFEIAPGDAGLPEHHLAALHGGDPATSAEIVRAVLDGEKGPRRDVVLLNAGAALVVSRRARDLREGVRMAAEAIDDGQAARLLASAVEASLS